MELFRLNGFPTEKHYYLFNGDFVDRGSWSTEIALLLYAYKWIRPSSFFINRGNHETDDMNRVYGFEGECKAKYNERTFKLFSESFSALPLATLIGAKYLVLHGGLFSDDKVTLDDIRKLNRHNQRQPGQAGLMMEMLWTDPQTAPGRGPSKRGVGMQFGPDVTKRFCDNNGLDAIIRSHEVRMEGYEEEHGGKCITGIFQRSQFRQHVLTYFLVFSAPKYCDSTENKGAYINIGPDYKLQFHKFDAVPHPDIKPMVNHLKIRVVTTLTVAGICSKLFDVHDLELRTDCFCSVVVAIIWMAFCIPMREDMTAFGSMRGTASVSNCILDVVFSKCTFAYFIRISGIYRSYSFLPLQPLHVFPTDLPPTKLPSQFPYCLTFHPILVSFWPFPDHPPTAATTALRSSLGTLIQDSL